MDKKKRRALITVGVLGSFIAFVVLINFLWAREIVTSEMAKLMFIPVSIISGLIAGLVGRKLFDFLWGVFDDQEPPEAGDREIDMRKLAGALVAQGAIFAVTRGLVDHYARRSFYNATGAWPGEERPDEA